MSCIDDIGVIVDSAQGTLDNGNDGPLVDINNDGSLHRLVVIREKDSGAMEDELV